MARRLLGALVRLLPPARRDLGAALLAESAVVPRGWRRTAWLLGGVWFVAKESVVRVLGYGLGLAAAVAALLTIDRIGTSDDSSQVSMLVLLVGSAALGFVAPRWAWLAGLVIGSALAVAGMIYVAVWPGTTHPPAPGGVAGAATLFVLVVPALIGAYLGAGAAWLWQRRAR